MGYHTWTTSPDVDDVGHQELPDELEQLGWGRRADTWTHTISSLTANANKCRREAGVTKPDLVAEYEDQLAGASPEAAARRSARSAERKVAQWHLDNPTPGPKKLSPVGRMAELMDRAVFDQDPPKPFKGLSGIVGNADTKMDGGSWSSYPAGGRAMTLDMLDDAMRQATTAFATVRRRTSLWLPEDRKPKP